MKRRLPSWLGNLLAPAEDPRRGAADSASLPDTEALLAELRRSRGELAQLRGQIEERDSRNPIAADLAEEERELLEAEQSLLLSLDERRARAALLRAADARVRADVP
jgi:uncharacterized protein YydD (DUF2326 family)